MTQNRKNLISAVQFPTEARIHIAIDVVDMEESIAFYKLLFGQPPTKQRADYAKFEVTYAPVNFAINLKAKVHCSSGVNHFGIQVKDTDAVEKVRTRIEQAGHKTHLEKGVTCCYAVQDKFWIDDPAGNHWEVFVTLSCPGENVRLMPK